MQLTTIDVWDINTFDVELRGELNAHMKLVRDYFFTSQQLWLEREASNHTQPHEENPYSGEFIRLTEHIMLLMEARTIRAWHYTRSTDDEVLTLWQDGIHLSTFETIRTRLAAQVVAGTFTREIADRLFADSPFHKDQFRSRFDKFWMVSHPTRIQSSLVELLLENWGGEATYFWQREPQLQDLLKRIGRPRVLEISMPLAYSRHGYSAAEAVIASFGRALSCRTDKKSFDLYTQQPLAPCHLLAIHTEGEPKFSQLARGYPASFIDVDFFEE